MSIEKAAHYVQKPLRLFHAHTFKNFFGKNHWVKEEPVRSFSLFPAFSPFLILPSMTRLHDNAQSGVNVEVASEDWSAKISLT